MANRESPMSDMQQTLPVAAPARAPERLVEFDAETHTYYVNGEPQQHVTGILKAVGAIDTEWFTDYARWRGSAVHKACQLYMQQTLNPKSLDEAIKPRLRNWVKFLKETKFVPLFIEQPVFDDTYQYAGTFDVGGYFEGEPAITSVLIEIKNFANEQVPAWVALQLAGYGRALGPQEAYRRIAVNLTDERYTLREFPRSEYVDDVNDFLAMIRVARWNQRHA
jgi:hypothetical protein